MGLGMDSRKVLRAAYERCTGELNDVEKGLLARVAGVGEEMVEMFWEDLDVRRRSVMGMRVVIARKEVERGREERLKEMERGRRERLKEMRRSDEEWMVIN